MRDVLLLLKFISLMGYCGAGAETFATPSPHVRHALAHHAASPALLVVWGSGYVLATRAGIGLGELWILTSLLASFIAQLALVRYATTGLGIVGNALAFVLMLAVAVALMVWKPTWMLLL